MRKLAEKVSKSANEIIGLISTFKDEAEMAVKSMDKGAYVVEKGVEFANNAGQSLLARRGFRGGLIEVFLKKFMARGVGTLN